MKYVLDSNQESFRRGLRRGQFSVGRLEVDPDGVPPWGTVQAGE